MIGDRYRSPEAKSFGVTFIRLVVKRSAQAGVQPLYSGNRHLLTPEPPRNGY